MGGAQSAEFPQRVLWREICAGCLQGRHKTAFLPRKSTAAPLKGP